MWATSTFRQKSSRRAGHINISHLQDPASRSQQIHRSGRPPDSVGAFIKKTIISEGLSVPENPGTIWAVSGPLRARPGTGRFREVHASEISIDVRTRERRQHEEGEEEQRQVHFLEDAPESKKYEPTIMLSWPAIELIGDNKGKDPSSDVTVS